MNRLIQTLRLIIFFILVLLFSASSAAVILFRENIWLRRKSLAKVASFYSKLTLQLLGIKISTLYDNTEYDSNNVLIVANHLSYLDVLIMSAIKPCVFVTSTEIRDTPFLGHLSQLAGCVYVERRNREKQNSEINEISHGLEHGLNVCVFPEATSTNGESVLRFRRPLFASAIRSKKDVLPASINYMLIENTAICKKNRDQLAWYDDMEFFPHLWQLMSRNSYQIIVCFSERIRSSTFTEPGALAEYSHTRVSNNYLPLY